MGLWVFYKSIKALVWLGFKRIALIPFKGSGNENGIKININIGISATYLENRETTRVSSYL